MEHQTKQIVDREKNEKAKGPIIVDVVCLYLASLPEPHTPYAIPDCFCPSFYLQNQSQETQFVHGPPPAAGTGCFIFVIVRPV